MHYYSFNIADYRKDTQHLTPIEHYIYRELLDWYYLDEAPIPKETKRVLRRLRLVSENDQDLQNVFDEFFEESEEGWVHHRIEAEIGKYHAKVETAKANGSKGGRPKKPKKTKRVNLANPEKTGSKANHKPRTNNQEPLEKTCPEPIGTEPENVVFELPTNKFNTQNETAPITESMFNEWVETYPAVDVMQALKEMRSWLNANPTKRKTKGGMAAFAAKWLAKDQNRGGSNGKYQTANEKAAERDRETRDYSRATNF